MNSTPVGNRVHIAIFGRRNAGKSSLINAITSQELSVVSNIPGTTTDPVYKTMELLPIGPVMIIDTAGLDDEGELGNLRVEKTYDVVRKTNVAILVVSSVDGLTEFEEEFARELKKRNITVIGVVNKCDIRKISQEELDGYTKRLGIPFMKVSSQSRQGIEELKNFIAKNTGFDEKEASLVEGLVRPGEFVVLVTPIDTGAPKGRLILPQQQTIRAVLDSGAVAIVTREHELKDTLRNLSVKPSLVITDSQAFSKVDADTPGDIPLTSFSILFARQKGELTEMVRGLKGIKDIKQESKILIVEGCTHHRQGDDIGKVKIPGWIRQMAGCDVEFEWASGTHFPKDIERFDVIIHCGGCMLNRQEMQYRINFAKEKNIAITNYGMLIAYTQGILKRALQPFPAAAGLFEEKG